MAYSYDRYERQRRQTYGASTRRSALGYWIPLALTVTVATAGLVAWIWSERRDGGDDRDDFQTRPEGPRPDVGSAGEGRPAPVYDAQRPGDLPHTRDAEGPRLEEESLIARMSGAIRRTPSPQQLFDGASRRVVAGVTAAGAAVGGALSSIREEDRGDFEDHSRWSEEAEPQPAGVAGQEERDPRTVEPSRSTHQSSQSGKTKAGGKRKTIAVVVSADTQYHSHEEEVSYMQENAVGFSRALAALYEAKSNSSLSFHTCPIT